MLSGCIYRDSSWFKASRDRERAEITKNIRERVSRTPRLRKLEAICRDVPYFSRLEPIRIGINKQYDALFFGYDLRVDVKTVQNAATDFLEKKGWKKTNQESGLWEEQIEFENGEYRIQVTHGDFGEMNYYVNCTDLNAA